MGTVADLQSEWARLVIESLVQAGIRDAVVSPGSRSTPFVIAALEQEGLRCVRALDERSGAHYALGQARATGRPSLVLCTSGSAPANYFPAVVEANEAGVPLVVLSADRPPELLGCGANQTTDQIEMYGTQVRFFANLGEPHGDQPRLRAAKRLVTQVATAALGPKPGPVHLNAQARNPLEPTPSEDPEAAAVHARVDAVLREPLTHLHRAAVADPSIVEQVARAIDAAARPVVLCGPADVQQGAASDAVARLAERAGALIVAEAASQFRFGSAARTVLGAFDAIWSAGAGRAQLAPDFVLQLGANPVSKGWERLSAEQRLPRVVVHPWAWADPSSSAEAIVHCDVTTFVEKLADREYDVRKRDADFERRFRAAEQAVWKEARAIVESAGDALTEAAVGPAVVEASPDGSALVLGNSLPIRDVDRWVPPRDMHLRVFAQRGVSGIDGLVSSAAGVASHERIATTLLVGDVSFLHDLSGLELASHATRPLIIVVINNGGGRIFEQLSIARQGKEAWLRYFTTPHQANLAGAASIYGCRFHAATTVTELGRALEAGHRYEGCTVIEAIVPPGSALEQSDLLAAHIERAFQSEAS